MGLSIAQALSHRPLSAQLRVRSQVGSCETCGRGNGTGAGFYPSTSDCLCVCIIPPILHIHLHPQSALARRANERNLGTFQKTLLFRQPGRTG